MAAIKLIILLLPAFVTSLTMFSITHVNSESSVDLMGFNLEFLTDKDREVFQIRDHELKQGIFMLTGELPNNVEVGYPYSHRMHFDYSWDSVLRNITPIEYKIIRKQIRELTSGPVLYPPCDYDPPFGNDLTISSQWHAAEQFTSSGSMSYHFWLEQGNRALNLKRKEVTYTGEFGKRHEWNSGVKTGSGIRSDISLYGKQANMHVKQMVLEVEVKYKVKLHGTVACTFSEGPKSGYDWGYDVNKCLKAAHRPTKKYVTEVIKVIFYYDEVFRLA